MRPRCDQFVHTILSHRACVRACVFVSHIHTHMKTILVAQGLHVATRSNAQGYVLMSLHITRAHEIQTQTRAHACANADACTRVHVHTHSHTHTHTYTQTQTQHTHTHTHTHTNTHKHTQTHTHTHTHTHAHTCSIGNGQRHYGPSCREHGATGWRRRTWQQRRAGRAWRCEWHGQPVGRCAEERGAEVVGDEGEAAVHDCTERGLERLKEADS
jgi:hypothetical protein